MLHRKVDARVGCGMQVASCVSGMREIKRTILVGMRTRKSCLACVCKHRPLVRAL